MKKVLFALVAVMLSSGAFAQTEPNYGDITEVVKSFKVLADSCPESNPRCTTVCTDGIRLAIGMNNGGNITSQQRELLKAQWTLCYQTLYTN
ncbi:MAG: hypothetical protein JXQ74_01620 [Alphaproteobacteria bacterium]|nr:hypothetical protein [Alphaproteobacteria bacterium]